MAHCLCRWEGQVESSYMVPADEEEEEERAPDEPDWE